MKLLRPLKAIRAKCIDCSGGYSREVRLCTVTLCPLYPYRMGKRPQRDNSSGGEVSSENVEAAHLSLANEGPREGD